MPDIDATILDAIEIPGIWRPWFRQPESWAPWRAFLKSLFGLPMEEPERQLFEACTGRAHPDPAGYNEAWLICGRRAGKSFTLALIACYLALFRDWTPHLVPGENGVVTIIARDRTQAGIIFRYARALLTRVPALAPYVERAVSGVIELTNDITIQVQTASYGAVRGYTIVAALCDEVAFWQTEVDAADPDEQILAALRPAMATVPGGMLLVASSPYARRGALWNAFRRFWGEQQPDGPARRPLVWRAATRTMNPTVTEEYISGEYERDPISAAAEFGAEFRRDIEAFIAREVVDAAVVPGRHELPKQDGVFYIGFLDAAGGSGSDSMTLAIGHSEGEQGERRVLDLVREWVPPFSPDDVTREVAATLDLYGIASIKGDRYGGDWVAERFREYGVDYEPAEKFKNDLYREFLPILNSGRAELLEHPRLIAQLCALERRTARGGRESIDHPPNGHDDIANAAAGVLTLAGISRSWLAWQMLHTERH